MTTVALPDQFWSSALGLDRRRELESSHALSESDPILCLLHVPTGESGPRLAPKHLGRPDSLGRPIGATILSVGYLLASREPIRVGPAALSHTYLKPSALDSDAPRLADWSHDLNLITIKNELRLPTDFTRLNAVWPGPVF